MTVGEKAIKLFTAGDKLAVFELMEALHDQGYNYRTFPQVVSLLDPRGVAYEWLEEFERDILV